MAGKNLRIFLLLLALAVLCGAAGAAEGERLRLATTTSLQDTGLLDLIKDKFDEKYNATLDVVSGGTGIAIQYAERGDVDVLIVHDKVRELKFIDEGYGLERRCIAYNYFYLIGPKDDPAGVKGMNVSQAMATIMEKGKADPSKVMFISRGDNSGTHAREKLLWKGANYDYSAVNSSGPWYIEAGQGMGATLNIANEKQAYTLSDMSTFMAYQGNLTLVSIIEGGDELLNVYVAMAVNPKKHPGVNCELANELINYLVSDEGQNLIAGFGKEKFGTPLFSAARGNCELIGCSAAECAVSTSASCAVA
ncbi:MAG: substrate-binding domain-containing protein [Methanotrichaceae archaeon]|nr:substrate-binding domain-containing protein [Methanotrichaceae archaeon]